MYMSLKSEVWRNHSNIFLLLTLVTILVLSLTLRIKHIVLFPFNLDEGLYGFCTYWLFRTGEFIYLTGKHGPTLYYMVAALFTFLGDTEFAARLLPALLGAGMVMLLYPLRRHLGTLGVVITALLLAVSPLFIRYSIQLRHDVPLAFFTLAMVVSFATYLGSKNNVALVLSSICLGLALATKENAYITLLIFVLFLLLEYGYSYLRYGDRALDSSLLGDLLWDVRQSGHLVLVCVAIVVAIYVSFYTSFFTNPNGLIEAVLGPLFTILWLSHASPVNSLNYLMPVYSYFIMLARFELPALVFSFLGGIYYMFRRDRFMHFMFFWMIAALAIYSAIPYRTPHLSLYILLPMIIVAGSFLGRILNSALKEDDPAATERNVMKKAASIALLFLVVGFYASTLYSTIDQDMMGAVTGNESLTNKVEDLIRGVSTDTKNISSHLENITDGNTSKTVVLILYRHPQDDQSHLYWPLPWYIRHYSNTKLTSGYPPLSGEEINLTIKQYHKPPIIASMEYTWYLDAPLENAGYTKKLFNYTRLGVYVPPSNDTESS